MLRERRHDKLLSILGEEGVLPVREVARRLGVSEATARRDLTELSDSGRLTRVYGGAVAARAADERPFADATVDDLPAKAAIAGRAADLVADGEVVLLDFGATAVQLSKRLHGRPITVVTSNLAVCDELRGDPEVRLIVLGGEVFGSCVSVVGPLAESSLRELYVDRLFLGASSVLPNGTVLDSTHVEIPVKRAMIASSRQVVLLASAGKFPGASGGVRICGPEEIDMLITNSTSDPATLTALRESGVEVITT